MGRYFKKVWAGRYIGVSRTQNKIVDSASRGGGVEKNAIGLLVHGSYYSRHEPAELREAADGGEHDVFAVASSAYAAVEEALAAVA